MADGLPEDLAYSPKGGHLAYKRGSGDLIYRFDGSLWAVVEISWGDDGKDLDICGYWTARPSATVGWSQGGGAYRDGIYQSIWSSGDNTGVGGMERIYVRAVPWSSPSRVYKAHFNFYGANPDYPASTCMVKVRGRGMELVKMNQPCSRNASRRAETGDPFCTITFSDNGTPVSIT